MTAIEFVLLLLAAVLLASGLAVYITAIRRENKWLRERLAQAEQERNAYAAELDRLAWGRG